MMTVRFPNGQAIQYNSGGFVVRRSEFTDMYESKGADGSGEGWIAQVPNTCLIEVRQPCRVYDALQTQPLEALTKEVRSLKRKISKSKTR